jgi:mannose-6-phosphate isomerase-like protein (cupin superfamily)
MKSHALLSVVDRLDEMEFHNLAAFNEGAVGVFWSGSGTSPWERHPNDDELLQVIEGEVLITVLTDTDSVETVVGPGCAFVVPKGCWHRQHIPERVKQLYVTPGASEHSHAEDPRRGP